MEASLAYWLEQRHRMIEHQLRRRGIADRRVLEAMGGMPREEFIAPAHREASYTDEPVSIGFGQTISQPYIAALMAECLRLQGTENVLEVGAGCGYNAALLGCLAASVVSMEIVPELAALARSNLDRTGYGKNVRIVCGDGSLGWPPAQPYDAILVAAAAPETPSALLDQLADPGCLVIPVGPRADQDLQVITRWDGRIHTRTATFCRFVLLRGKEGWR